MDILNRMNTYKDRIRWNTLADTFTIKKFRYFESDDEIPFRPINLVFGKNGTMKSTFLEAVYRLFSVLKGPRYFNERSTLLSDETIMWEPDEDNFRCLLKSVDSKHALMFDVFRSLGTNRDIMLREFNNEPHSFVPLFLPVEISRALRQVYNNDDFMADIIINDQDRVEKLKMKYPWGSFDIWDNKELELKRERRLQLVELFPVLTQHILLLFSACMTAAITYNYLKPLNSEYLEADLKKSANSNDYLPFNINWLSEEYNSSIEEISHYSRAIEGQVQSLPAGFIAEYNQYSNEIKDKYFNALVSFFKAVGNIKLNNIDMKYSCLHMDSDMFFSIPGNLNRLLGRMLKIASDRRQNDFESSVGFVKNHEYRAAVEDIVSIMTEVTALIEDEDFPNEKEAIDESSADISGLYLSLSDLTFGILNAEVPVRANATPKYKILKSNRNAALLNFPSDPDIMNALRKWKDATTVVPGSLIDEIGFDIIGLEKKDMYYNRERVYEVAAMSMEPYLHYSARDLSSGQISVLVMLIFLNAGLDLFIEEPELHLHPSLQSKMLDVILNRYVDHGQHFWMETHSENILLRCMRRTREGVIPAGSTNLIYIKKLEPYLDQPVKVKMHRLGIGTDGDFSAPWPEEFFAQRMEDVNIL